jgi:protein-disulfide isomerase
MRTGIRAISPWIVAVVLMLGPSWALAQKGRKISLGDSPSMKEGSPGLVLIEVSDFQCPYCGEGFRDVLPQIHGKFVQTGKVELIFLDLPLQMHPNAFKAAEAAACAGDQKKFWEMHDLLFDHQRELSPEQLPGYAGELGLDVPAFQACLSSGKHAAGIRQHIRTANSLGLRGTPDFVLGRRIPGGDKVEVLDIVGGLPPYEELEKRINALLVSK